MCLISISLHRFLLLCGTLMGSLWVATPLLAQGYAPDVAAAKMRVADGFRVDLIAAEPHVRQPVSIEFDDRGRLWVIQYLQYPNPAGLKRVKVDRYSRTVYDRVPKPPPHGPRGADKITILEDTDGDGRVDSSKDFIDGLNLTTGFAFGHGGLFVLNVPYLLFYPDRNRDDIPDGDPEVLLEGFGMEDTSSLANSLSWGPDGWLYGTQGTNITANICGIEFEQGVWRYHPVSKKFELFCEGGGNSWGLDFDRLGNLLYSTNHGGYLMHHGVQGAYYEKSFQKHGELHNPYAFGYFKHVPHQGFQGGHVTVGGFVYQADAFPAAFRNRYLGGDLLGHGLYWHHIAEDGSTFRSAHGGVLFQANDTWFAPSDVMMGPDGAVYVADWHDKRTAHPDPDADWDRSNGRVFRIQAAAAPARDHIDPLLLSSDELVDRLSEPNIWHLRRAQRVLAERRDQTVVPRLRRMILESPDEHLQLQSLWALYVSGGFNEQMAEKWLDHPRAAIRAWTVRFLGDERKVSPEISRQLERLASEDSSRLVITQLACSAKRLPAADGLPILASILARDSFAGDPYIPLLCWWGVEAHALTDPDRILELFAAPAAWQTPLVHDVILPRLVRRLAAEGNRRGFASCTRLLKTAPTDEERRRLLEALDLGLAMIGAPSQQGLPSGTAFSRFAEKKNRETRQARRFSAVPPEFTEFLETVWSDETTDPLVIRVTTRLGDRRAYRRALTLAGDRAVAESTRLAMLDILNQLGDASTIPVLLKLMGAGESTTIQRQALLALSHHADDRIVKAVLDVYPNYDQTMRAAARSLLFGRSRWALAFLKEIDGGTYPAQEVPIDELRRLALHQDAQVDSLVRKHWGEIRAGTPEEKLAEIRRLTNDLRAADGDLARGHELFKKHCAVCHQYFGAGNKIGPDLTNANRKDRDYLLVSLVDPSAQIRKEYLSYVVVTGSGRVVTGLMAEQTPTSVTIVGAKNERTTIARDEIEEMKESPVSLMPEKQLQSLKPQEVRDLFRYLQK